MANKKWSKVAKGVAVATIGAAVAGAVHFMFLAPQFGTTGDFFGIPMTTLVPFLLGTALIAGGYLYKTTNETLKDLLKYGGAAAIGFSVANYADWMAPVKQAVLPRTLARPRPTMQIQRRPTISPRPTAIPTGTKMI